MKRRRTREVRIGEVPVGGEAPISVQSMTNTDTRDVRATKEQIRDLAAAGCDIVRVAVPDMEAARELGRIREASPIPLVADIHFDYRLALAAVEQGVDALRINPGNIGSKLSVREVAQAARRCSVPIRVGVNAGSLEKEIQKRFGARSPRALVRSALLNIETLESVEFSDILVSLKSSDVRTTVEAYRLMSTQRDYPLHLGVTEAGTPTYGTVKSAIGIGSLLLEGIGDTLRVSLTGDPTEEIRVGQAILRSLGLRRQGVEIISCPTCGRCEIDLIELAESVEKKFATLDAHLRVAVMGCAVNGPGEAREADIGIAGGRNCGLLFREGRVIARLKPDELLPRLYEEVQKMVGEKQSSG